MREARARRRCQSVNLQKVKRTVNRNEKKRQVVKLRLNKTLRSVDVKNRFPLNVFNMIKLLFIYFVCARVSTHLF